jgi:hypothetical protein
MTLTDDEIDLEFEASEWWKASYADGTIVPVIDKAEARDFARAIEARVLGELRKQEPLTESYMQTVPDKCDRIVWRNSYYMLPINSKSVPAVAPIPPTVTPSQQEALSATDKLIEWKGDAKQKLIDFILARPDTEGSGK